MAAGRPSIRDVAREAGVSTALASFALNDRAGVAAETKERILRVAGELGYRPDPTARALRTGLTGSYGLMVRNMQNPYFLEVFRGAQDAASAHNSTVFAVDSAYSVEREREHVHHLAQQRVDGLAIAPVGSGDAVDLWQELCPGKPVVVVNAVAHQEGITRVGPDNVAAVDLAVEHLHDLGHRRITFYSAPAGVMADHDRLERFEQRCRELGVVAHPVETALNLDAAYRVTCELLDGPEPPTAIVTNSDFTAHAVYRAARDRGVQVGAELSVIGHDDLATSALLDPPLTTLRLDRFALGRAITERLRPHARSGDYVQPVTLVVRGSTAPPH
ncbi:LacI family DNA-binding transcriptional regulator [Ornithinicoccus hortensis]|uniref:LacI family transcriptional regulator n=1 Tax=Ornithinicoccus hortensis TaxID=82346 RepID=A0A542YUW9_9MICO|nr:LacI family DNA-binding transcriptional regulator [Ornithinicoccus hortensis]TQL51886.1 LacI family transcriptional regulator [Ornithinicoccus hortensis]